MSIARKLVRLHITIAVAIQRTIGRILSGGKKNTNIKTKIIPNYFAKKYIRKLNIEIPKQKLNQKKEIIWQFWDNPAGRETPLIVDSCIKTVEKFKGDFGHIVLDMKTIGKYSDLPGYVFDRLNNGQMIFAHFADLLRLNLLKNHGGVWTDATNYMTAEIPKYIMNEDFFVFLTDKLTHFPYSFMQNFFIRAKQGSFLCNAWHDLCLAYWKGETKDMDYFMHQLMFKALIEKNKTARELFAKMPHVSEDQTLQFVGDKQFQTFDKAEWNRIKNTSFMQKLTYKSGRHTIANISDYPGSYFEKIIKNEL